MNSSLVQASFYNPLSQFVVKLTNPVLIPMRRVIPGYGGVDMTCIVLMLLIEIIKYMALYGLVFRTMPSMGGLVLLSVADLGQQISSFYFFTIIMVVILSWVSNGPANPVVELLYKITTPILRTIQRVIPPIAGFDLSPMLALIGLKMLDILVLDPFSQYANLVVFSHLS